MTAVIVRPAFSKESLVNRFVVTSASSLTVCVSLAMSATAVTVRLMVWVVVKPSSSVMVTTKLSAPL